MEHKRYNVCLLNDSFPPLIDGVANAVINYAEIIQGELGSATVVTPSFPGFIDDYPFPVVRYSSLDTQKAIGYRAGYPFSSSMLESLNDSNFNVIHSHCPFASTVLGRTLREKNHAPLIMTYHTKFDEDIKRIVKNPILVPQIIKFVVQNINTCDEIWTVSRGAGENLRNLGYEGEYRIMPNGVDFPKGKAETEGVEELRAAYGITDEIPGFLFVGRLFWYKGLRLIFDSLKRLSEKGIRYKFLIVGDGGDREEMESYAETLGIAESCIFIGAINDREELRYYYTASNLFLFPSLYDTNGIVVREAAACGLPSILVEGSCAAEDFSDKHNAILTKNDTDAFTAELEFAVGHLSELKRIGENAMNEVYMSWEDSVKRAYDRYEVVIENCRRGITQCRETKIQEVLYSSVSDITDSIQKVRSITANSKSKTKRFSKAIKRTRKVITSNIASNLKEFAEKLEK
ncbi:MAG: glycosyltransferase [Bacteroides sp.]|nr:glycosyltransferase [Eubacterium sp.]MCM1418268.1 glycosyltransferase [Roseburia sp.]MCM1462349.1 glycosyltransferase [Bacteroides sp.]